MKKNIFTILTSIFCVSLIVSNIIAGKLWSFSSNITLTAGILLFPIVYIIGDVIPEVYGLKTARKVIWIGFFLNLFSVMFFIVTLKLPYPVFWQNQISFETVLSFTPRLLLASFVAFLVGSNANAWMLVFIKKITKERFLWMRTIGSTIVGESLDSFLFIVISFFGSVPSSVLLSMIIAQASFKILYETVATPLTYLVINYVKKIELKNID